MGKLQGTHLKKILNCIKKDSRVIIPPTLGYDAGIHAIGDRYLAIAADPCIDVPEEWFGWLLVNYAASDVALVGAKPEFCTITLLGPPRTTAEKFHNVMMQVCSAADELSMAIVRGHTGTYTGLSKLVGVCTAYGTIEKENIITSGRARSSDFILFTRPVGLETLINFSLMRKRLAAKILGLRQAKELQSLVKKQSCVQEAIKLGQVEGVHAMHDATEGGLTAALNEMAEASKVGFEIESERLPITPDMRALQRHFKLSDEQVLSLSCTGGLVAAVDPKAAAMAENRLRAIGTSAEFVGTFTRPTDRVIVAGKARKSFPSNADDYYARILSGKV